MKRLARPMGLMIVLVLAAVASATHPAGSQAFTGASMTLLPDGRWLILGGEGPQGSRARAEIADGDGKSITMLAAQMHRARAWHTATVLPDGTVLILGGIGRGRSVVREAELFHPSTQTFELVHNAGPAPRAFHTASLLTDGRLLIVGGTSEQGILEASVEAWSPAGGMSSSLKASLSTPRRNHEAVLLPDGRVWISGGIDSFGTQARSDEAFDATDNRVTPLLQAPSLPLASERPRITASMPPTGGQNVPADATIAIRFSKPVRPASLSADNVRIAGPAGAEIADIVAAEGGRLAFITPAADLLLGAEYTVALTHVVDADGIPLPATSFSFTTALPPTEMHAGQGAGPFGRHLGHHGTHQYGLTPPGQASELDEWQWRGERRDGKPYSAWQSLLWWLLLV